MTRAVPPHIRTVAVALLVFLVGVSIGIAIAPMPHPMIILAPCANGYQATLP